MRQLFLRLLRPRVDRTAAGLHARLALGLLSLLCLGVSVATAQVPAPKGKPKLRSDAGNAAADGKKPEPASAESLGPGGLPKDFKPQPQIPDIMLLNQPLLTPEEVLEWKKFRIKYATAMRNGSMTDADKKLIVQGLKYRLYIMTLPEQQRTLHERRLELVATDLQQAAKITPKAPEVRVFRTYVMEQLVKLIEPLLQNNVYVRLQAATLLGELDLMVDDPTRGLKHETYTPGCELLLKVLDDPAQPTPIKIAAARSIIRLVHFGVTPVELRHRIATSLLNELAKADTHYWYQMRLAEALSTVDVSVDLQNRKPFVVNGLLAVVRDSKRDFRARAEAARALGRVPFDPQVDISGLMRDLMKFAEELATAAQQDPASAQWKQCFFDLYLAYKPLDGNDKDATKKAAAGLLNNTQTATAAQQTYKLIVPLVNSMIADKPISLPELQSLQDWLKQNAPPAQLGAANGGQAAKLPGSQPVGEKK
ncbi:MAG: hypothetical protein SFV23_23660 [Planctomycetaceae bacterium]|nr:hypothetical protein [Planctomycetaceae bacterium]